MIDYDNPKHIKILLYISILGSLSIGTYGLYLAFQAIIYGYIYISTNNFSGIIYFDKNPYRYLFFVCLLTFGGAYLFFIGIYLLRNQKKIGTNK
jgi:hypothetical protein